MKYRVVARNAEGEVEAYLVQKLPAPNGGSAWNDRRGEAVVFESREEASLVAENVCCWDYTIGIERDEPREM
jgi:hypothetical protein